MNASCVWERVSYILQLNKEIIERIMSTCAICLSNEFNASMLTAINLNVVKLIAETLLFKTEKDSVNFLY